MPNSFVESLFVVKCYSNNSIATTFAFILVALADLNFLATQNYNTKMIRFKTFNLLLSSKTSDRLNNSGICKLFIFAIILFLLLLLSSHLLLLGVHLFNLTLSKDLTINYICLLLIGILAVVVHF
jgi:hypothetical protein